MSSLIVSINLALLKRQLNKKIKEMWFSYYWEAFKITKSFNYSILLKAGMSFNLDGKILYNRKCRSWYIVIFFPEA